MAHDDERFWNLDTDFLDEPPKVIVSRLIRADASNYNDAQAGLRDEIALYDRGVTLLVSLLQAA